MFIFSWMYNFQRRMKAMNGENPQKSMQLENGIDNAKMGNGNINTIEALALASEGKGQMNGVITNVIHQTLEPESQDNENKTEETSVDATVTKRNEANLEKQQEEGSGVTNRAFQPDV